MKQSLFEQFRQAMLSAPHGSRKDAQDAFVKKMLSDPDNFRVLAIDYFERMSATWVAQPTSKHSAVFQRTSVASERISRTVLARRGKFEAAGRDANALEAMKAKIREVVLLDLVLPNGKALRDATGAECAKAGGFFSDVAKALKPSQVVDKHLTEDDLKNIRARFYKTEGVRPGAYPDERQERAPSGNNSADRGGLQLRHTTAGPT